MGVDTGVGRASREKRARRKAARARTVHETTDLIAHGLKANTALLIDVELDRAFKPM